MPKTRWHIIVGTYGTRLHGGSKPTTDRRHNRLGESQIVDVPTREQYERSLLSDHPILLTPEQQLFIQSILPEVCRRGGWGFVEGSAASNHVHVVLDADSQIHGKQIRPLLKRWLTQALNERWVGARRSDGMAWHGGPRAAQPGPSAATNTVRS
jgi:REP element-mobilizing transposase RayT